jgi:PAS domain S-box-containing protein
MYVELIQNASLILALTSLYGLIARLNKFGESWSKVLTGLLFGCVAMVGMQLPFHYTPGVIYDGRSIILSMAGLFGGGTVAVVSAILAVAYRAYIGGAGVWAGIGTIIGCSGVGLAFRRGYVNRPDKINILSLYAFGIVVHVVMLACQLFIQPWPSGIAVINRIWLPILLIFPIVTVLMGLFLGTEERRIQAELSLRKSESLLSRSQSIGHVGSWEYDVEKNRFNWSAEVFRIFGLRPQDFAATYEAFLDIVHPDDRSSVDAACQASIKERKGGYQIEHRIIRCDTGEIRIVLEKCENHKNTSGKIVRSIGLVQDITERKEAEDALRKNEAQIRAITDAAQDAILMMDQNGCISYWNPAAESIFGYTCDKAIGKNLHQLIAPQSYQEAHRAAFVRFQQKGQGNLINKTFELKACHKDGHEISVELSLSSLYLYDCWHSVGIIRDITKRKQDEEEMRENREMLNLILDTVPQSVFWKDLEGRYLGCNRVFASAVGIDDPTQIVGKTDFDLPWPQEEAEGYQKDDREVIEKNHPKLHIIEQLQQADGTRLWVDTSKVPLSDANGRPFGVLGVYEDITDRRQTEEALRESVEKFRLTFSSSPDAVNINRLEDGLYVDINEGFTRTTGYTREEVIGRTSLEINIWHDPADRQKLVQGLLEKGYYENLEALFRMKDGSLITALMSAKIISLKGTPHIISITRDITERKLIETKLQQAQKFEAIGTLAGGVAHDFNNLLMGIQGHASLLSFDLEPSHPHREHFNAIEEYIRSASNLTKQLLGFARGGKYEVNPVDVNELVHGTSVMFGRTKREIRIHTKCQASPLVVEADRGQIEQVLLNMYINAWQAMPPDGGHLYLETKIVTLDETNCKPHQLKPGRYAKVSITDSGAGMDEATRLRIFDPFFTTKEMGRGTGLGLASAYGIIKNHGGIITVYSEVGHGTTFNIYLPASDKESHREVPIERGIIKGSATILLVDDEELIINVGQAMLERLGYRVMVCRGGQEAVKAITDIGNEIDLVILDMIMPGMDGGTTFDRIREIQPDMPVILSSGYAINGHADKIMRKGCNGFIQKPYNFSELSQNIRKVLDETKGSSHA